jgi:hypothetical protein
MCAARGATASIPAFQCREASMSRTTVVLKYFGIALAAAGAGVLAGVLVAPASGRETRRRWTRRLENEAEQLKRTTRRLRERLSGQALIAEQHEPAETTAHR